MARRVAMVLCLLLLGLFGSTPFLTSETTAGGGYYYPTYSYGYATSYPQYRYDKAGYVNGKYYPAGYYYWNGSQYYLYGYGAFSGYDYYKAPDPYVAPPSYSANWQTEIVKYGEKLADLAAYQRAIQTVGFSAPPVVPPYAQSYPSYAPSSYAQVNAQVHAPIGGQTLFGYTYDMLRSNYGDLNLNTLYQAQGRLAQGQQQLSAEATAGHAELVDRAGSWSAKVAEILARGQAGALMYRATEPQGQSTTQSRTTVTTVAPISAVQPGPNLSPQQGQVAPTGTGTSFLTAIGNPRCGSCHSGSEPKGKFQIKDYPSMSPEQKAVVLDRIFTTDPKKRMPRTETGEPIDLPPAEKVQFILN